MKVKSKKKKKKKDKERKPEKRSRRSKNLVYVVCACASINTFPPRFLSQFFNTCSPKMEKEKSRKKRKSDHDRSEKVFTQLFFLLGLIAYLTTFFSVFRTMCCPENLPVIGTFPISRIYYLEILGVMPTPSCWDMGFSYDVCTPHVVPYLSKIRKI